MVWLLTRPHRAPRDRFDVTERLRCRVAFGGSNPFFAWSRAQSGLAACCEHRSGGNRPIADLSLR